MGWGELQGTRVKLRANQPAPLSRQVRPALRTALAEDLLDFPPSYTSSLWNKAESLELWKKNVNPNIKERKHHKTRTRERYRRKGGRSSNLVWPIDPLDCYVHGTLCCSSLRLYCTLTDPSKAAQQSQGIQTLLEAEKEAAKIVQQARQCQHLSRSTLACSL